MKIMSVVDENGIWKWILCLVMVYDDNGGGGGGVRMIVVLLV